MNSRTKSFALLHLVVFIWGFTGILGKAITLQATQLVWIRMLFAILCLLAYMKLQKIPLHQNAKSVAQLFFVGVLISFHWIFFYHSIKVSNVSVAVVCLSSATFFTSLFEPLIYKRRVYLYELLFGVAVIVSLYFIFRIEAKYFDGMVFGIASALFSSMFTVFNGKLTNVQHPVSLSFYELLGGFLLITIYYAFNGDLSPQLFNISGWDMFYLILLATVCTAFPFVKSVDLMKVISPFTVVLSVNLEPVYSVILAAWLFKEYDQLTPAFYGGTLMILATIALNGYLKSRGEKNGTDLI